MSASWAAAWTLALLTASAADASSDAVERPLVVLQFKGDEGARIAFTASLRELLGRVGVTLSDTAERTDSNDILGEAEVDWSALEEGTVRVRDAGRREVLVRRISKGASGALALETAAHWVQAVVDELAHPLAPPVAAPPVREVEAVVAAALPPAAPIVGFDTGVFVLGRALGNEASLAAGAGVHATLSLDIAGLRPSVWLLAQYQIPVVVPGTLIDLRVQAFQTRAGLSVSPLRGPSWRIDLGFGAGLDVTHAQPTGGGIPGGRLTPARWDVTPILSSLIVARIAAARTVDFHVAFALDVDLQPRRYLARVGGADEVLYSGWLVHPALLLGGNFNLVGPAPFASHEGGQP